MTPSKILLYFCLSFIGGIFLNSLVNVSRLLLPGILILGIILAFVLWRHKKMAIIGFCVLFSVLGIYRHQTAEIQNPKPKTQNDNEIITLTGIVAKEPSVREKSQKLIIKTKEREKILITASRYPEYKYGDKLEISGKIKTPSEDIEGFNYKDYLRKDGIYSVMDFPKTELLARGLGNPAMEILLSFKNKFKEAAASFIPPPELGILEALVFGDESEISNEWKEKLNLTGTRHIAAVSGMNITIIASLLLSSALSLGLWRKHAFYLSVFLLFLYVLMIGAPPSAVRASAMAGVFLLAQNLGRMSFAHRAVVFAGTFMVWLNPLLLRLDIGFQLSFLAILGIIFLQPFFGSKLRKIPNPKFFPLRTTISTTLSAQIFTFPILIFNFGYISLISMIPNILIVPFLALITILIFIFGLAGIVFWPLGWALSWPVFFSLSYIIKIIDLFSKIPFALLKINNLHWVWLIVLYSILAVFTWRLQEKERLKFLKY